MPASSDAAGREHPRPGGRSVTAPDMAGRDVVTRAASNRRSRSSAGARRAFEERGREMILRDIALIDTTGSSVGQINGLSVLALAGHAFGRPTRITARVRPGTGRIVDIEREVELGGPLHSKGVLILQRLHRRPLCARRADVAVCQPGVRAVLWRRRRRQRLVGGTLRAALGAGGAAAAAGPGGDRIGQSARRWCRRSAA